jgi:hypothetical protein
VSEPPLSKRTAWNLRSNRLAEALKARLLRGAPVLDLTETNPTRVGLADLAPLDPAAAGSGLAYTPQPFGLPEARQAVARDFARRGANIAAAHVALTASTSEAYAWLFKLLCDPGDSVLTPRPSYPLFEYLAGLESVRIDHYDVAYDGEWHVSVDAIAARIDPATRAIVAVSPNNPTGSFLKRGEAEALVELCRERGLALICDEVFADYPLEPVGDPISTIATQDRALCFALGGLSKSCGLPQAKLAWIATSGPAAVRERALARLEIIADTYLSVSTAIQTAAPALLEQRSRATAIGERLGNNLETLRELFSPERPATLFRVEGGWSAVVQVPATLSEEERTLSLLEVEGVLVHPGYFFDFPAPAHAVLSLLTPPRILREGTQRLLASL